MFELAPTSMPHRKVHKHTRDDWRTPGYVFEALNHRFAFDGDACASDDNNLVDDYFTNETCAISSHWSKIGPSVYMNPPYSQSESFAARAYAAVRDAEVSRVVALMPSTTDTRWFHRYVVGKATELWFVRGRLSFVCPIALTPVSGNPVGSMVIVWGEGKAGWAGTRTGSLRAKDMSPFTNEDKSYWSSSSISAGSSNQVDLW